MVKHAIEHGIKPTASVFMTTPKTVRKWVKRYEQGGYRALDDASRAPHHPPKRIGNSKHMFGQIRLGRGFAGHDFVKKVVWGCEEMGNSYPKTR